MKRLAVAMLNFIRSVLALFRRFDWRSDDYEIDSLY